jgi:MSHA pilin protein MshD
MSIDRCRQSGVTLIELILAIVIISVGLAGALSVFDLGVKRSADPLINKQAQAVAEALMEEILLKDFAAPTSGDYAANCPTTCDRSRFDNSADYNNYGQGVTGVRYKNGNPIPGLEAYTVLVGVAAPASFTGVTTPATDALKVDVTVGDIKLTSYRFRP